MKTKVFEKVIIDTIDSAKRSLWRTSLQKKHPYINLIKKQKSVVIASCDYVETALYEVPTFEGHILMNVCMTNKEIHFYYSGFVKDESSSDCLNDSYQKYCMLKTLGVKL
jgi:hypothetical protein